MISQLALNQYAFKSRAEAELVAAHVVEYGCLDDHTPHNNKRRYKPTFGLGVVQVATERGDEGFLVLPVEKKAHLVKPIYLKEDDTVHLSSVAIGGITIMTPEEGGFDVVAKCVGGKLLTVYMTEEVAQVA